MNRIHYFSAYVLTPALLVAITASVSALAGGNIHVYVSNECDTKQEYCVEDGSSLSTSLSPRSSITHDVSAGARFKVKSGSACGAVVFTAPASPSDVKFSICKK